jgi:hypothetical protein
MMTTQQNSRKTANPLCTVVEWLKRFLFFLWRRLNIWDFYLLGSLWRDDITGFWDDKIKVGEEEIQKWRLNFSVRLSIFCVRTN